MSLVAYRCVHKADSLNTRRMRDKSLAKAAMNPSAAFCLIAVEDASSSTYLTGQPTHISRHD